MGAPPTSTSLRELTLWNIPSSFGCVRSRSVPSCPVPLRSPARDRLVRPVDDHPLVVIRPSRGGHRRGPGLVETYRLHVPHFVPHFSYMYPMYPKWGTSGVQKVAPPNEGGCEIRMGLWLSLTINIFILLLSSFPCPGGSSPDPGGPGGSSPGFLQ